MDSNSSRSKARLIVVTVFVIGFAAGALALNLYEKLSRSSSKEPPRNGTEVLLKRMNDKVGLSSDQQDQIKKILDETNDKYKDLRVEMEPRIKDFEPRFNAVRQESRDRIRALLNAEQLPKYEQMVTEHDKMREQEKEQRSKK
jgi:succinate dehydrogenase/fumarate reductase flavoprotein subunit